MATFGSHQRPMYHFLSTTASRNETDLAFEWLASLDSSLQSDSMDDILTNLDLGCGDLNAVSREALIAAADAVLKAYVAASVVCRQTGRDEVEALEQIKKATLAASKSGSFRGIPGVADAIAAKLEILRSAGLLDSLQSSAVVNYFRSK